jgi:uncharacterized protein (DUF2336 family)
MTGMLSKSDVERLLKDPSLDTRADVAAKVARQVDGSALSPQERAIAEDIIRVLSRDAALRVRQTLSEQLKESRHLPHDVAVALAGDVEAVALPVLSHSAVLTDEDLIATIGAGSAAKQVAIAARRQVSAKVAEAIVVADEPVALATLAGNEGAELTEPLLLRLVSQHPKNEAIQLSLARRARLPLAVLERLVAAASTELRATLAKRTDLPDHLASDLVLGARERATASLMSPESTAAEAMTLAQQLWQGGRLTAPLVVRAICLGDLAFVEAAFAVMADIPVHNARLLIYDAGPLGFKAIYERCKLPPEFLELFRIGIRVAQQTELDGGEKDRERRSRRTLERILTQYEKIEKLGNADLEYLLGKLRAASDVVAA